MEAASDARLLYDMLAKMLQYPVFLDSAKLIDLRQLISHGVADCDVMLVLATKKYITRPWCLLEILHATRLKTPIIVLDVKMPAHEQASARDLAQDAESSPGTSFSREQERRQENQLQLNVDESLKYLENIEENMGADDPAGLELLQEHLGPDLPPLLFHVLTTGFFVLQEHLGPDLTELIWACTTVLTSTRSRLVWNPNASDSELVACLKDIIDAMATATGNTLNWTSKGSEPNEPRVVRRSSSMQLPRRAKSFLHEIPALHLVCDCDEAMADARVLQVAPPHPMPTVHHATLSPQHLARMCMCVYTPVLAPAPPAPPPALSQHPMCEHRPRWR